MHGLPIRGKRFSQQLPRTPGVSSAPAPTHRWTCQHLFRAARGRAGNMGFPSTTHCKPLMHLQVHMHLEVENNGAYAMQHTGDDCALSSLC